VERIVARAAGLDVPKDTMVAQVHLPGGTINQASFATTTPELVVFTGLAHRPSGHPGGDRADRGVPASASPTCSKTPWKSGCPGARPLRNIPGRTTEGADASWICQVLEFALVRPSFVPPAPIRELRNLLSQGPDRKTDSGSPAVGQDQPRHRRETFQRGLRHPGDLRTSHAGCLGGRHHRPAGAHRASGRLQPKLPALCQALPSRFGGHHALLVALILAKLDVLDELIG